MLIEFDMMQTMAVGILSLLLGEFINRKSRFLRRICIPAPVTGGIVFSLFSLAAHLVWTVELEFDATLKDVCMVTFFTTVGFQSDMKVLRKVGRPLVIIVILMALLVTLQNLVGIGLAKVLGVDSLLGMAAGSITMCGGHGTAAGFSSLLEGSGLDSAVTILMAAATFGLLGGSLIGGPLSESIIRKKGLAQGDDSREAAVFQDDDTLRPQGNYTKAIIEIFLAAGLGTLTAKLLDLSGITFPTYFGALITAAIMRNLTELVPRMPKLSMPEITSVGGISLSLFLGMAMVTLKLWELYAIALPLLVILLGQILLVALFSRFLAFPLLGRDYDAAVLVGGICGFGLGAIPNAMANMSAVCNKYHPATIPFIVVPIVGAMFVDIINIAVISLFLHLIH